jgi:hypothetical protein
VVCGFSPLRDHLIGDVAVGSFSRLAATQDAAQPARHPSATQPLHTHSISPICSAAGSDGPTCSSPGRTVGAGRGAGRQSWVGSAANDE